jgi:hypothetical protein
MLRQVNISAGQQGIELPVLLVIVRQVARTTMSKPQDENESENDLP